MMDFLEKTRFILRTFVELGFLTVLSIVLLHLLLAPNSGPFVSSVANNVQAFANGMQPQALVGLAIVLALVFLIWQRWR